MGLTSVGTRVFFGLTLLVLFPLRAAIVVGTDIFHAAALLWLAGVGHIVAGNVDLSAAGWLLIGSVPGVLFSSQFTVRMPDRSLRLALSTILIASGVKLLDFPNANVLVIAVLAGGAVLVALSVSRGFGRAAAVEGTTRTDAH